MGLSLPYSRPRLFTISNQQFIPSPIRNSVDSFQTYLWLHRLSPIQSRLPYQIASDVIQHVLKLVSETTSEDDTTYARESDGISATDGRRQNITVVDCCSGPGLIIAAIEKDVNQRRKSTSSPMTNFLLSDPNPRQNISSWAHLLPQSPAKSLSYLPYSVNPIHVPLELTRRKHIRVFLSGLHQYSEDEARRVLEDGMRSAEAIVIFEYQRLSLLNMLRAILLIPLCFIFTPIQSPNILTLFFTYIIPLIPIILFFDTIINTYRTRTPSHVEYLANLASVSLQLEGEDKGSEWVWDSGRRRHSWLWGEMLWITGRKERI